MQLPAAKKKKKFGVSKSASSSVASAESSNCAAAATPNAAAKEDEVMETIESSQQNTEQQHDQETAPTSSTSLASIPDDAAPSSAGFLPATELLFSKIPSHPKSSIDPWVEKNIYELMEKHAGDLPTVANQVSGQTEETARMGSRPSHLESKSRLSLHSPDGCLC